MTLSDYLELGSSLELTEQLKEQGVSEEGISKILEQSYTFEYSCAQDIVYERLKDER